MFASRINTGPRLAKSGKADANLRCEPFLKFLRGRYCRIHGRGGHVCSGKVRACHVDYAGGKGTAIRVSDKHAIPMCDGAHAEQTDVLGWGPFEAKYRIDAKSDAATYFQLWPGRVLWLNNHPDFEA